MSMQNNTSSRAGARGGLDWLLPSGDLLARHALLLFGLLFMLFPILWVFTGSLKTDADLVSRVSLIPDPLTFANYPQGWTATGQSFGVYILNSTILCSAAVLANLFACSLTAYAFARIRFPGKGILFSLMLLTIFIPRHISIIPEYVIFQKLGLVDSIWPMIIPKLLGLDGFFVFLMVQFIRALPVELEEAAEMDGSNRFQIFLNIVLPTMKPALATTAILTFLFTYQDFLSQLIFLNTPKNFTVPLGLQTFIDQTSSVSIGPVFAMSVVSLLPVIVMFLLFQKQIIDGSVTSGLKG
jgi:multiple sugar transport system permease protein